jgi:preprotein translocase subunit SecD
MKPNVQVTLRAKRSTQARQTIERRVNELGVAEPSIAQQGPTATRSWCSCPASPTSIAPRRSSVDRPARAEDRRERPGGDEGRADGQRPGAARDGDLPGVSDVRRAAGTPCTTCCARSPPSAARPADRAAVARRANLPAVSFTLKREGAAGSATSPRRTSAATCAIVLDGRVQSAPRIEGRITTDGRISGSFSQQEVQDLSLGTAAPGALPARLTYLEERTIRSEPRALTRSFRCRASIVGLVLDRAVHDHLLQAVGRERRSIALIFNLIILLGPDGVHRRGHDAAGHRRIRPDDGYRRRLRMC